MVSPSLSVITLNVNELNPLIKKKLRVSECIKQENNQLPPTDSLQFKHT